MADGVRIPIEIQTSGANQSLGSLNSILALLRQIDSNVNRIGSSMGSMGGSVSRAMQGASQSAGGFVDKLGKIGLAFQGVKGIVDSTIGAIAPVFEEGLSREKAINSLKTLMPAGSDVEAYARELRDSAMAGLYGSGSVMDAAKTMMSFGIDAGKTKELLKSIGDIAGGDAQAFKTLTLAMSQATSLGKLQGQDKLQMIGAGFNPLTQIAKDLGVSMQQVDEMVSKGLIDAETLQNAFINATSEGGAYYNSMAQQMSGMNGSINTMQASISDMLASLYEALTPIAQVILPVITSSVKYLTELLQGQHPVLSALLTVVTALGIAIGVYNGYMKAAEIATSIMTAKQWLLNFAMDANPVGIVIAAITALIALVAAVCVKYDEWGAALSLALGPLGVIINLIQSFRRNWDDLIKAFKVDGFVAGFKKIGAIIMDAVLMPLEQLFRTIGLSSFADKMRNLRQKFGVRVEEKKEEKKEETGGIVPGVQGAGAMGGANNSPVTPQAVNVPAANQGTWAVATGVTRSTAITISLGSLVHTINYSGGIRENSQKTTNDLQEALLRVLNAAAETAI